MSLRHNDMIPFHDLPANELIEKLEIVKHKEMLDEPEAALFLNITINAIRSLRYKRKIAFHKYGDRVRYAMEDLLAYRAKGRIPALSLAG